MSKLFKISTFSFLCDLALHLGFNLVPVLKKSEVTKMVKQCLVHVPPLEKMGQKRPEKVTPNLITPVLLMSVGANSTTIAPGYNERGVPSFMDKD